LSHSIQDFEVIFRQYHPGLLAFAQSILHNIEDAEEIVHDVFLGYWNEGKFRELQDDNSLKGYLFRAVKNRSLNQIRKNKIEMADLPEDSTDISLDPSIEQQLEIQQIQEKVNTLIDQLPKKCRQIFIMSRNYEMSHKEIAEIMDITPKTVENQISIALKFLRPYFKRD